MRGTTVSETKTIDIKWDFLNKNIELFCDEEPIDWRTREIIYFGMAIHQKNPNMDLESALHLAESLI